jgi:Putative Ig domain
MRSKFLSSAMSVGGLLASAALALSVSTVTHAETSIYGTPNTTATAQRWWAFQPWATDTDHRGVTYTIKNKPYWASFDSRYGHLYGVPANANVGTYSNIVITASDGVSSASLPPFSLTVNPLGSSSGTGSGGTSGGGSGGTTTPTTGSATVNWVPPTQNTNGSSLTNLAGYTISYGTSASQLTSTVKVTNAGLTSYVIENLPAGTYYFGVEAYNSAGETSAVSNVASKTIK